MAEFRRRASAIAVAMVVALLSLAVAGEGRYGGQKFKNAYAAMMYMGTPRDYEFYIATRVLMRSLIKLDVRADLVVIASLDVPLPWVRAMEVEDGVKVVRLENVYNPFRANKKGDRFKLTMNKIYAWSLVDYDRVVMLDADNLFLHNTDELFQCGQFCAVFINPCIFHTGLFVLQPSMEVYKDLRHELEIERPNSDGADQGFLGSYFPDLLDKPMFYPPGNNSKLTGQFRLPLGYQMDASYYYLRLKWNIPCGPNSVITFPGVVWLKPWYWWSWPVLPLGFSWHEQRRHTLGYGAEMSMVMMEATLYIGIIVMVRLARPRLSKLCYRRLDKSMTMYHVALKFLAIWSILAAYVIPFFIIPHTIHPLVGWSLYLLGSFALCWIAINAFFLPSLAVMTPGIGIFGTLLVMAYPWYKNGIVRGLSIFIYAFCASPFLWVAYNKVMAALQISLETQPFLPTRLNNESPPDSPEFTKIY